MSTVLLKDFTAFIRQFYLAYHPYSNGSQPLIHPQPAGVAVTDSSGRYGGWHAITIQRVALDDDRVMRGYFFNPNNDSGQDWGHGVVVSTNGKNEHYGESSLLFAQLASRLYIYHEQVVVRSGEVTVPELDIESGTCQLGR